MRIECKVFLDGAWAPADSRGTIEVNWSLIDDCNSIWEQKVIRLSGRTKIWCGTNLAFHLLSKVDLLLLRPTPLLSGVQPTNGVVA